MPRTQFAFPGYSYVYDGSNLNGEFVRVNPKTTNLCARA